MWRWASRACAVHGSWGERVDLAQVMQELADQLATIDGLRAYGWPPGKVPPPAAIVTYPSTYTYDDTYGRGSDTMTLQVVVLVGRPTDRTSRDNLGVYVNGSGASSVKQVLESGNGSWTTFDLVRVSDADFDVYEEAGQKYLAAIFNLDLEGPGST